jgi:diguanylate cyclase (GGDEF)-like protein
MVSVFECVTGQHNIWLVLVAALVCVAGAWTVMRLFQRAQATKGTQRLGWHFLTAVAAGSSIWCTHFVAVLAYRSVAPVTFDPVLTILSLLVAIGGAAPGFAVTARGPSAKTSAIGGGIIGLAISAMHYTGMLAYRVEGVVTWNQVYLTASILLAVALSAIAMVFATRRLVRDKYIAIGMLVLAIVSLHFTAMTAFQVHALTIAPAYSNPAAMQALAMAVAVVGLMIIGTGLVTYLIDDQTRTESVDKLRHMALNDPLTGLPNRAGFTQRLAQEVAQADAGGSGFSLIVIDLDRFKEINDVRGHSAGDEVLLTVARRMSHHLASDEFVARLGGDEFAAIHRDHAGMTLEAFIERLEKALFRSITLDGYEIAPGASIGVARYPQDAGDKETLINNADLAMYRAKSDPTRRVCFYEPSMDEAVRARRALGSDLRDAIAGHQLAVYYQPQNSVATGETVGFEALVRWTHPTRGPIPPAEFIPLAEETGVIMELGEWVLRTACADAAAWEQPYKIAVNLSPVQFAHANLAQLVHEILIETGLSPLRLELELTETTIVSDKARSLHVLREIKALGVSIALDDFGTGYSSLETLRAFPFDKIKLDRSFMSEIESSPQAKAIIRAVLALGKSLDVPVLAEGIETREQLAILASEGCDEAQGYYLGRPAPIAEAYANAIAAVVRELSPKRRWA